MKTQLKTSIFEYVVSENPDASLSKLMKLCNEASISSDDVNLKNDNMFSELDIAVQSVLDGLNLSERERDISFITNFIEFAWKTLHIDLKIGMNKLNVNDIFILIKMFEMLKKYNLEHELLQDMSIDEFELLVGHYENTSKH